MNDAFCEINVAVCFVRMFFSSQLFMLATWGKFSACLPCQHCKHDEEEKETKEEEERRKKREVN